MEPNVANETVNKVLWKIPNVLCLVGSRAGERWNAMTTSWVTQVAMDPVLVAVGIDKGSLTHDLIAEGGSFSVNLWHRDDTRVFVKFSKPAVKEGMALNGRPIREGVTGVPVFEEAAAYLDCRVWRIIDAGSHSLILGEVADCGIQGNPDAPVARMEDTRMKYGGAARGGH